MACAVPGLGLEKNTLSMVSEGATKRPTSVTFLVVGFKEQLRLFVTNLLSFHDPGRLDPERVYQGFVVGLLAVLEPAYQVRSNRESGKGRPDVIIRPMRAGKLNSVAWTRIHIPRCRCRRRRRRRRRFHAVGNGNGNGLKG